MTPNKFNLYLALVTDTKSAHPEYRMGQTYFNVLYDLYPDIANQYRSTHLDPFYDDAIIPEFLSHLYDTHVIGGE